MTGDNPYTGSYYSALREGALRSARVVVPLVLGLVRPRSVVDVGCGQGVWLAVFREHGALDVVGVDGDYVDREQLEFPAGAFVAHDLTRPLQLARSFHLAVALEVAEHLPAECAGDFVGSLTGLAPVVLFSAAAPFQGGAHHVNEQWPGYWADLFTERDFVPVDCLRRRVWEDGRVEWWYAQNLLVFVRRSRLEELPLLKREYEAAGGAAPALVHPKRYLEWVEWGLEQCRRLHGTGVAPGEGGGA
jgi:SAM-dependent methyltransferase